MSNPYAAGAFLGIRVSAEGDDGIGRSPTPTGAERLIRCHAIRRRDGYAVAFDLPDKAALRRVLDSDRYTDVSWRTQ